MTLSKTLKTENPDEYWMDEGIFVKEIVNTPTISGFSLARCRLPQGAITRNHRLNVAETYIIEDGNAMIYLDQQPYKVMKGDIIPVAIGQSQYIKNVGNGDLIFLVHCTPRFTMDQYQAI